MRNGGGHKNRRCFRFPPTLTEHLNQFIQEQVYSSQVFPPIAPTRVRGETYRPQNAADATERASGVRL
jgi:hypothetical protein